MNATIIAGLITALAVLLFIWLAVRVGMARGKYKIQPPITDGPEEFVRIFRVQQNTLEQMVAFLPSLWLFATFMPYPIFVGLFGGLWLVARLIYAIGYSKHANKRLPGFALSMLATLLLLGGSFIGIFRALF